MHHVALSAALAAVFLAPASFAAGLYPKSSAVLNVDGKNFDKLIRNSYIPSIVEFYAPWCGHCQNLKPAYEKAAKSLEGIAQVAAVNCDDEDNKPFCGSMGIKGFPTLKTVRITGSSGKPIISDYNGARTATGIVDAAKELLPNHVKRIEDKTLDNWLQEKNESAKAILFSDKGTTSALIKALANDYFGNLAIAQIRDKEKEASSMFGVSKYPSLVVLPGGDKAAVVYDGEMKKPAMTKFLGQYASVRESPSAKKPNTDKTKADKADKKASSEFSKASASHASADASSAGNSAKTITLDDWEPSASPDPFANKDAPTPVPVPDVPPPIPNLETEVELQSKCLGPKTRTCILALLPAKRDPESELSEESTTALASLAELSQKHSRRGDHLFPFFAIPASNTGSATLKTVLASHFKESTELQLIAINGKRNWWRLHDASKGFGSGAVEGWIDSIRLDEGNKLKLPEGVIAEAAEVKEEEKPAASSAAEEAKESETPAAESESESAQDKPPIVHEDL